MNLPHPLQAWTGALPSKMGKAFPGERTVFRGHNLHQELGHMNWLDLYLFGITGQALSPQQVRVMNVLFACTSYPDARLWNNRVAALAGSARSTCTLALSAAMANTEALLFGIQASQMCADFLLRTQKNLDGGASLEEILQQEISLHKYIKGFGRPMATLDQDERFPVIFAALKEEGIAIEGYLQLVFDVEACLIRTGKPLRANYAAYLAAVPLQFGLSLNQTTAALYPTFLAGMPPCYLEALERPEGASFAMACEQIKYSGQAAREWDSEVT